VDSTEDRSISEDWYRQSFGALYPIVYAQRTVAAAGPEAAFAARELGVRSGEWVLDLCCGNGRHMVHLLGHTPFVVGLDYSPDLVGLARRTVGTKARLVRADMRAIPFHGAFDVVVSFFTSFGYFPTFKENARVVAEMARVMKPGARFFIDYFNAAFVEKTLVPESVREYKGYRIEERRWIDSVRRRVNKVMAVTREGKAVGEWGESVQLYGPQEFRALLAQGGLLVDRVFGNYEGASLDERQPRMIVLGHKG
jgi:SAM-dependent methyltransferase